MVRFAALALALATAACLSRDSDSESECGSDAECDDGECTRTHECVEAGTSIRVEVAWTVSGAPATEETCAPIASLEVFFYEADVEATSYAPIPCRIARSTYDKMPPRLDRVSIVAYDEAGATIEEQSAPVEPTGTTTVSFDLEP